MIKINLIKEVGLEHAKARLIIALASISIFSTLIGGVFLSQKASLHLTELESRHNMLKTEVDRLTEETKDISDVEDRKQTLRERLIAIATLKKSKTGPVQVMDQLNKALPERSWLTTVDEKNGRMKIEGKALDNETLSVMISALKGSEFFDDVKLATTKQRLDRGVKIYEFIIDAKVKYEGKLA